MADTFDKILNAGRTLDWITPLFTIIKDLTNGLSHHFYIDAYAGWSVNDVKRALKQKGVPYWGTQFMEIDDDLDAIVVTVKVGHKEWAEKVMIDAGVPLM